MENRKVFHGDLNEEVYMENRKVLFKRGMRTKCARLLNHYMI